MINMTSQKSIPPMAARVMSDIRGMDANTYQQWTGWIAEDGQLGTAIQDNPYYNGGYTKTKIASTLSKVGLQPASFGYGVSNPFNGYSTGYSQQGSGYTGNYVANSYNQSVPSYGLGQTVVNSYGASNLMMNNTGYGVTPAGYNTYSGGNNAMFGNSSMMNGLASSLSLGPTLGGVPMKFLGNLAGLPNLNTGFSGEIDVASLGGAMAASNQNSLYNDLVTRYQSAVLKQQQALVLQQQQQSAVQQFLAMFMGLLQAKS